MTYLLDANVLSETTRQRPSPRAVEWLRRHEEEVVVDAVILGEILFGILALPAGKKRRQLEKWYDEEITGIPCHDWNAETAFRWAQLLADLRRAGHSMSIKDSMIAATARLHDLTVATRNLHDFRHAGVKLVDPFA
jgi:toxin FitB